MELRWINFIEFFLVLFLLNFFVFNIVWFKGVFGGILICFGFVIFFIIEICILLGVKLVVVNLCVFVDLIFAVVGIIIIFFCCKIVFWLIFLFCRSFYKFRFIIWIVFFLVCFCSWIWWILVSGLIFLVSWMVLVIVGCLLMLKFVFVFFLCII